MGNRTAAQRQQYIRNYARTRLGSMRTTPLRNYLLCESVESLRSQLSKQRGQYPSELTSIHDMVYQHICLETDETLGRLAASGRDLQNPISISWFKLLWTKSPHSGLSVLRKIATHAVVLAILDLLFERYEDLRLQHFILALYGLEDIPDAVAPLFRKFVEDVLRGGELFELVSTVDRIPIFKLGFPGDPVPSFSPDHPCMRHLNDVVRNALIAVLKPGAPTEVSD